MKQSLESICSDFNEWPSQWKGIDEDLPYGTNLLEEFRPFAEQLALSGLAKKTIKKHLVNLFLLGGEIIRNVGIDDEYHIPPIEVLKISVGIDGGPYCRHLYSEDEQRSFDSTCRKLDKFLVNRIND